MDCPKDQPLPDDVSSNMIPYLIEAGIDVEHLTSNREIVVQHLLVYYTIEKRKLELDDISKGKFMQHYDLMYGEAGHCSTEK